MRGQSELIGSVILVALVLVLGVASSALVGLWVSQRISESSFTTFAELSQLEFQATLISTEVRGPVRVAYIAIVRTGILGRDLYIGVSIFESTSPTQQWWLLEGSPSVGYNITSTRSEGFTPTFTQAQAAQTDPSNLYVKHRGTWQRLLDLGVQRAIPVIGLGTASPTDIVVLNITLTTRANYLYIVVWTNHEGRQVASPTTIAIS